MMDWSRKGDILFGSGLDLWTLSSAGNSQPIQLTATAFTEMQARFSPSGRWIAYTSNEFGQYEVYVQSFPKMDIKRGVSTAGGSLPRWSADGKQLYYVAPGALLMSVPITEQATSIDVGTPRSLFRTKLRQVVSIDPRILGQYDVSADGRFLMAVPDQESTPMSVILNWAPRPAR
jgi:tricorn protease-like protein